MKNLPSTISDAEIAIVENLLASMKTARHDPEGEVCGYEPWNEYYTALKKVKEYEFGTDPKASTPAPPAE